MGVKRYELARRCARTLRSANLPYLRAPIMHRSSKCTAWLRPPNSSTCLLSQSCHTISSSFSQRLNVLIHGKVVGGRGKAAVQIAQHREEIAKAIGAQPFAGSLNLVLEKPVRFVESEATFFDNGFRMLWPATLNGIPVWLYRWKHTSLHIVEVISPINLRDRLRIGEDKEVTIVVPEDFVGKISFIQNVIWAAVWIGRRDWCYTRDNYYYKFLNFCRESGATQQLPEQGMLDVLANIIKRKLKGFSLVIHNR